MPGPPPKHPDRRQDGRRRDLVVHQGGALKPAPEPPQGLLKASRDYWAALWASPLARAWEPSDLPALRRLAQLYDERERAFKAFRKERIVMGGNRQPTLNPLGKFVESLDKEIRNLEDRFGLSPKARLHLGVTHSALQQSLETLNEDMNATDHERDPRGIEVAPDPRSAGL